MSYRGLNYKEPIWKETKNNFELARGSSYHEFELPWVKLQWMYERKSRGNRFWFEIAWGSSYQELTVLWQTFFIFEGKLLDLFQSLLSKWLQCTVPTKIILNGHQPKIHTPCSSCGEVTACMHLLNNAVIVITPSSDLKLYNIR